MESKARWKNGLKIGYQTGNRVVLNGRKSSWTEVLSRVPQGSVLGPILFTIFINDLDSAAELATILRKFADETKLGKVLNTPTAHMELQNTLEALEKWSEKWCMALNVQKCKVMHVGRTNTRSDYKMGGHVLEKTEEEIDIGVMVTPTLKPATQCSKAAKTATTVLGQISRAFHYRDRTTFLRLYKQYVRPHLEFSSQAWRPWLKKDVEILEKVQERAVRMIGGLQGQTYQKKLTELGLQSVEERMLEADLLMAYKVLHGMCKVDSASWFSMASLTANRSTRATADPLRLLKPRTRQDIRSYQIFIQ